MANAMNVNVPWIMVSLHCAVSAVLGTAAHVLTLSCCWCCAQCNGASANNTINTCNGNDCVGFLMSNGQSHRILIDQPALWTENEGQLHCPPASLTLGTDADGAASGQLPHSRLSSSVSLSFL